MTNLATLQFLVSQKELAMMWRDRHWMWGGAAVRGNFLLSVPSFLERMCVCLCLMAGKETEGQWVDIRLFNFVLFFNLASRSVSSAGRQHMGLDSQIRCQSLTSTLISKEIVAQTQFTVLFPTGYL